MAPVHVTCAHTNMLHRVRLAIVAAHIMIHPSQHDHAITCRNKSYWLGMLDPSTVSQFQQQWASLQNPGQNAKSCPIGWLAFHPCPVPHWRKPRLQTRKPTMHICGTGHLSRATLWWKHSTMTFVCNLLAACLNLLVACGHNRATNSIMECMVICLEYTTHKLHSQTPNCLIDWPRNHW